MRVLELYYAGELSADVAQTLLPRPLATYSAPQSQGQKRTAKASGAKSRHDANPKSSNCPEHNCRRWRRRRLPERPWTPRSKGAATSSATNALKAKLRRLCEMKRGGKLNVPLWAHEQWKAGNHLELARQYESVGFDKDWISAVPVQQSD